MRAYNYCKNLILKILLISAVICHESGYSLHDYSCKLKLNIINVPIVYYYRYN